MPHAAGTSSSPTRLPDPPSRRDAARSAVSCHLCGRPGGPRSAGGGGDQPPAPARAPGCSGHRPHRDAFADLPSLPLSGPHATPGPEPRPHTPSSSRTAWSTQKAAAASLTQNQRERARRAPSAPGGPHPEGPEAPGPGPAHGGGAVCTPGPPGTGCSGVGALHAELPIPPGLTQRLLWVSGRGTRLALGEMREAARGPRRVCACACVCMGVHACACVCGAGGGFRGESCRPSPPHTPRRASLTPGSAGRRPPRGPRGLCPWTPGLASGEAGPWRPPSCPALSCGDLLRDGAPGSEARRGRLQPGSAQRPRGRGAAFWGGRPGREQQGAAGGLGGAGRVAKSSDGDGDRDGRAEGGCPLTTGSE